MIMIVEESCTPCVNDFTVDYSEATARYSFIIHFFPYDICLFSKAC